MMTKNTLFYVHQAWQQMHLNVDYLNAHSHAAAILEIGIYIWIK